MANIRQFADNMPDVGIPNPPTQQFATDSSGATREAAKGVRRQGQEHLAQSLVQAGAQTIQGVGAIKDRIAAEEIVSGESSGRFDSLFSSNEQLPEEEYATFRRISEARQSGLTADQARAESSALLRSSIARDPKRAAAYKAAHNEFFGDTGAGAGTFVATDAEKLQEYMLKQGWQEFDIDPRVYHQNPVEWEKQFQDNLRLKSTNNFNEQLLKDTETIQALTAVEQRTVLPGVINNVLTNPESESYLPNIVDNVMLAHRSEDGRYDSTRAVQATRDLESMKIAVRTKLRENFGAMKNEDFNNYYSPVEEFFDNAIAFANGEMSEEALVRENRIFKEGSVRALYNVDPDAARAFVGLTELIKDLDPGAISPFILQRQEELSRLMIGSTLSIVDPASPVGPYDNARTPAQVELVGESVGALSNAAYNGIRQGAGALDGPNTRRVNESVVYSAKAIISNPEDVSAQDYAKFYDAIGNVNAAEVLTEETRTFLAENFEQISSTFIKDTLDTWMSERRPGTRVVFDPDTNRITALPEDASSQRDRSSAQRMNREMAGSNSVFRAMSTYLGKEGAEVLSQSEVGRGVLAMSGIEVDSTDGHELQFRELPMSLRGRMRIETVADKLLDGTANDNDISNMNRWIDEFGVDTYNIPKLQEAISILRGETEQVDVVEDAATRFEGWLKGQDAVMEEGPTGEVLEIAAPVSMVLETLSRVEGTGDNVTSVPTGHVGVTPGAMAATGRAGQDPTKLSDEEASQVATEYLSFLDDTYTETLPNYTDAPEAVRAAILDMSYNTGPVSAARMPSIIAALEDKDYSAALLETLDTANSEGKAMIGLARRRAEKFNAANIGTTITTVEQKASGEIIYYDAEGEVVFSYEAHGGKHPKSSAGTLQIGGAD